MSAERYKVMAGSQSAHCCFSCTIIDTSRPSGTGDDSVCECFEEADAKLICDALNAFAKPGSTS